MKLIATRDFSRTPQLQDWDVGKQRNKLQVSKGTVFDVCPSAKTIDKITPKTDKLCVASLVASYCVAEWSPEVEARIKSEIVAEERREANVTAVNDAACQQALSNSLGVVLAQIAANATALAPAVK